MLRLAYEPDDPCCRAIVGGSIPGRFPAFDFLRWIMRAAVCLCKLRTVAPLLTRSQLSPVRLGIAYTVTALWPDAKYRAVATRIATQIGPKTDQNTSNLLAIS
jgi:hypothetical protein